MDCTFQINVIEFLEAFNNVVRRACGCAFL